MRTIDPVIEERNKDIEKRFVSGETLQSIGNVYGITRERVRQILVKRGIQSEDGGAKLTRRMKRNGTSLDNFLKDEGIYDDCVAMAKEAINACN